MLLIGGKLRAFHTAELPLAYRRGAYPESEGLSRQLGGAWAAFARKGDPNHSGMPNWSAYTASDRQTMVFDAGKTMLVNNPSKEALEIPEKYPSNSLL